MSTRVLVEPSDLVFIQSRAVTNTDLVDEYAEMMQNGVEFDPVRYCDYKNIIRCGDVQSLTGNSNALNGLILP